MNLPFIEIIESITPDPNMLMWKFEDEDKDIKNGARLTVRESQHALLINEGVAADVFGPGLYELSTENIPILTRLKNWKHGFISPFKADVYFFNTHQFISLKWGTPAPIIMPDSKFGQVRIKAFGAYNIRISDVKTFFSQYAGTYGQLTIMELGRQLRDFIAPKFGEILASQGYSIMDVAGNISDLSDKIAPQLEPFFAELGLELTKFQITSVTLPDEVTKHYDTVTSMNMVDDIDKLQRFNTAAAIGMEGTALNQGVQQGVMVGAMINQMQQQQQTQAVEDDIMAKLKKLKAMFDAGLINESEYSEKKADLLSKM
jgi:Putative virion core protein (lumpy skin disease virus)